MILKKLWSWTNKAALSIPPASTFLKTVGTFTVATIRQAIPVIPPVVPTVRGLEYTLSNDQMTYTLLNDSLDYTLAIDRLEYSLRGDL